MSARGMLNVGGALLLSIVVVGASVYYRGESAVAVDNSASIVVAKAAQKEYIEPTDSDSDGVPDWEQSLRTQILERVTTPTLTIASTSVDYVPPDTFTGQFAEQFFANYLEEKKFTGTVEDPTLLINRAVTTIQSQVQNKRFSRGEIVIVPDSLEAARAYGNNLFEVAKKHPVMAGSEFFILQEALGTMDPKSLTLLDEPISSYENLLLDTLKIPVPEMLVRQHLDLLNAYGNIITDLKAMQSIFDDPLYALARLEKFFDNGALLFPAFLNIIDTLINAGVRYSNDEPGAELLKFAL